MKCRSKTNKKLLTTLHINTINTIKCLENKGALSSQKVYKEIKQPPHLIPSKILTSKSASSLPPFFLLLKSICILALLNTDIVANALECKLCAAGTDNNCNNDLEQFDNCEGACYRQTNADGTRTSQRPSLSQEQERIYVFFTLFCL